MGRFQKANLAPPSRGTIRTGDAIAAPDAIRNRLRLIGTSARPTPPRNIWRPGSANAIFFHAGEAKLLRRGRGQLPIVVARAHAVIQVRKREILGSSVRSRAQMRQWAVPRSRRRWANGATSTPAAIGRATRWTSQRATPCPAAADSMARERSTGSHIPGRQNAPQLATYPVLPRPCRDHDRPIEGGVHRRRARNDRHRQLAAQGHASRRATARCPALIRRIPTRSSSI